nr:hypothetical protein [Kribbella sp. VKM Ac-2571]
MTELEQEVMGADVVSLAEIEAMGVMAVNPTVQVYRSAPQLYRSAAEMAEQG